jgi:hypothetical protein
MLALGAFRKEAWDGEEAEGERWRHRRSSLRANGSRECAPDDKAHKDRSTIWTRSSIISSTSEARISQQIVGLLSP